MSKYRISNADGYEIRTRKLRRSTGEWLTDNMPELTMLALLVITVLGLAVLVSATAQAVDTTIEYVDEHAQLQEDNYHMQQLVEALEAKRMQELIESRAEQPPYWTASSK